jgi:hypothetical protein
MTCETEGMSIPRAIKSEQIKLEKMSAKKGAE